MGDELQEGKLHRLLVLRLWFWLGDSTLSPKTDLEGLVMSTI